MCRERKEGFLTSSAERQLEASVQQCVCQGKCPCAAHVQARTGAAHISEFWGLDIHWLQSHPSGLYILVQRPSGLLNTWFAPHVKRPCVKIQAKQYDWVHLAATDCDPD